MRSFDVNGFSTKKYPQYFAGAAAGMSKTVYQISCKFHSFDFFFLINFYLAGGALALGNYLIDTFKITFIENGLLKLYRLIF